MKKGWKYVGENDITLINSMLEYGMTKTKIEEVTGRSYEVISRIKGCKNLADYKAKMKAEEDRREAKKAKKAAGKVDEALGKVPQTATGQQLKLEGDQFKQVISQLNAIIAVLKAIEYQLQKGEDNGDQKEAKGIRHFVGR